MNSFVLNPWPFTGAGFATLTGAPGGMPGRDGIAGRGVAATGAGMSALAGAAILGATSCSPTVFPTLLSATSTTPFAASELLESTDCAGAAGEDIFCRAATKAAAAFRVAVVEADADFVSLASAGRALSTFDEAFGGFGATTLALGASATSAFTAVESADLDFTDAVGCFLVATLDATDLPLAEFTLSVSADADDIADLVGEAVPAA